ncbi:uncharacterized protein [Nicotiana tomentosiformis]|uniref:uncharacterized protein isoform X2 n=1 Tax=Nicotiana tomentosiformis TaxID=4098 RepID=UPI00051B7DD1|nr:uncharacterized protein LOC104109289 isoform X2 [Nicotiana tomentosiformis]
MEEGLKGSSMCSTMKHELDLNRDPFEQTEPALTLTDSVSKQDLDLNESITEVCENDDECDVPKCVIADVDSEKAEGIVGEVGEEDPLMQVKLPEKNRVDIVVGRRRGRKKKVKDSTEDKTSCQVELENKGSSLMSGALRPSEERKCEEGTAVENGEVIKINVVCDGNGEPHGEVDASKGRGRRGRKKKEVKDSRRDDVSHDGDFLERGLICNGLVSLKGESGVSSPGRQIEQGVHDFVGVESGKITKISENSVDDISQVQVDKSNDKSEKRPGKRGRGRKRTEAEASECHDNDVTAGEQVDASSDGSKIKVRKRGRGRKRKDAEDVERPANDHVKRQKVNTVLSMGQFKRVLRSGTVAVIDGKKHVFGVKDAGVSSSKTENNIDPSDKKILKARNDGNARLIERGKQKPKGRRGRPPKMQGTSLTSSQKDKLRGPKRSMNDEKADGLVKGSKHLKVNQTNDVEEALGYEEGTEQANAEVNNEGPGNDGNKRLGSDPYHDKQSKSKGSKAEVKEFGVREQKQAVREQIIDMLMKSGWTVEYRPRLTKDYKDAIWYDPEGRQHWSVTLAYKRLKERVEAGAADDKTRSAFTPIPEDVFSTLFRGRKEKENKGKKKQTDVGCKASKKMTKKKQSAKGNLSVRTKTGNSLSVAVRRKKLGANTEDGKRRKPCALLARSSKGGGVDSDGDEFILYDGKRTLLAWMIDLGVIQSNAQVHYIYGGREKVKQEGKITGDGICCGCCGETLKLADFESHAGSELGLPFQNVFLQSGQSLLQCLVDSWNKQNEIDRIGFHSVSIVGDDPNDDTCNICGDGGDLICCDSCPSTFHQSCLDIQKLPSGDWRCVYCSCKFCGTFVRKSSENDVQDDMLVSELLTCHLCEGKFHLPCVPGDDALDIDSKDLTFCGKGCQKIFEGLQMLLGVRHDMDEGFCWTLLRNRDFGRDINLSDDPVEIECNCKLAVAFSIMDECFVPIVDQRSKINIIQSVVYSCGSNFRRMNYHGFYTVILEKGDELISAASIRIHGNQVVEMPFIGTRYMYRRQGMCRRLLTAIETALCSLDVEKLVIPAIPELIETWTKVFGFTPLEKSERQEMKYMSMMVFPGTDMLQKPLLKDQFSEGQGSNADAFSEVKLNQDDKGAILRVEPSLDVADGFLNDTSDLICDSTGSLKATSKDSHQIENVMGCLDLPVPNGYICDKTSTSDLSSLNSPLASQETSNEIMRSNLNDHKEVSVGAHILSLDSKSLQDVARLPPKSTEELESC